MATVAIDVDDTLARTILADEAAKTGSDVLKAAAYAPWTQWRTPPDMMGLEEWLRIIDLAHDEDMILQQEPYSNSVAICHQLAEQHEIVYVSSRNTERYDATLQWLQECDYPDGVLTCSGHDKTKHLQSCQYIIDDRPSTLVRFVYDYDWKNKFGSTNKQMERIGFGLQTEFNGALTDVPNIYLAPPMNWLLLKHYLVKTGVLADTPYYGSGVHLAAA